MLTKLYKNKIYKQKNQNKMDLSDWINRQEINNLNKI